MADTGRYRYRVERVAAIDSSITALKSQIEDLKGERNRIVKEAEDEYKQMLGGEEGRGKEDDSIRG